MYMGFRFEKREESNVGLVLLFLVVALFLGFESQAAEMSEAQMALRGQVLSAGSLIEITDDIDFGLSREKRFCTGQDAGFFRNLMTQDCCTLRINALEAPLTSHLVIKKGPRRIKSLDEEQRFSALEGRYELILNCGPQAPSAAKLEAALGSRVRVHEIQVAPALPKTLSKNSDSEKSSEVADAKLMEISSERSGDKAADLKVPNTKSEPHQDPVIETI